MVEFRQRAINRATSRPHYLLSSCLEEIYSIDDLKSFATDVFQAVRKLVPFDSAIYCELGPKWQLIYTSAESPESTSALLRYIPIFSQHLPEHPLLRNFDQVTSLGSVYKISDFSTQHAYRDLGIYYEIYRHLDIEYQIAFELPISESPVVGYSLNRKRSDFREKERSLLAMLKPHIVRAYRHIADAKQFRQMLAIINHTRDSENRGILLIEPSGEIEYANDQAKNLLVDYFGVIAVSRSIVPRQVKCWLDQQSNQKRQTDPLQIDKPGRRLSIHLVSDEEGRWKILHLQENVDSATSRYLCALTPREREILFWVAHAKTDKEISMIIQISSRTVQKHLENIYKKFGVENRLAAANRLRPVAG